MITSVVPFAIVLLPLYIAVVWLSHRKRPRPLWRLAVQAGLVVYLLVLVDLTLMPIPIQPAPILSRMEEGARIHYNLIPFRGIYESLHSPFLWLSLRQIAGNAVLLAPLGFLLPWLSVRTPSARTAAAVGLACSMAIEGSQLLLSLALGGFRTVDVDDLMLNTLSAVMGYSIAMALQRIFRDVDRSRPAR